MIGKKRPEGLEGLAKGNLYFLFENANDANIILDKGGKFVLVNKKIEEVTGFSREELVGKQFLNTPILTTKSKAVCLANFLKRMTGKEIKPYEIEAVRKSGEKVFFEINATPIKENGQIVGDHIILRDLTERKKMEEQLGQQAKKLEELNNKMKEFSRIASHDMKCLANSQSTHLEELLKGSYGLKGTAREKITDSLRETKRMNKIINEMLDQF